MSPELSSALSLLAIGMITVFFVLLLVVGTGRLLIRISNLLVPKDEIDPKKIAIISSAVEVFTEGKGRITKIEKY